MKLNKFENLAKLVAGDFLETMNEFGFETFKEMVFCYDWTSKDIKEEITYMVNVKFGGWIDDDGDVHICNDIFNEEYSDYISYRKFSSMVRSFLR